MKLKIVCVLKSGGDYMPGHVHALRDMCRRWMPEHEFVCLTDVPDQVECATVKLQGQDKGWWAKMEMFHAFRDGHTLSLDLDTLLRGPCHEMVEAARKHPFVVLRDFYRGVKRPEAIQSSVMFWQGDQSWLWDLWQRKAGLPPLAGDQDFLELAFWKAGWEPVKWQDLCAAVCSFKAEIRDSKTASTAPMVCFHGKPRPWEQTLVPYPGPGGAPQPPPVAADEPCVVVGNGPSVLRARMGGVIDAFPQVVRINQFRVTGFEAHAGTRTTLYATSGRPNATTEETKPERMLWLHGSPAWNSPQAWLVPKDYYWGSVKDWSPDKSLLPSAGYLTVKWLLDSGCARLHLTGFDHFSKLRSALHHYWVPRPFAKPREHDGEREAAIFSQWETEGRVRYL